jgi:hypothetical protein
LIELDDSIDLPDGTEVEVTIIWETYKDAWDRQEILMRQGFSMGEHIKNIKGKNFMKEVYN